jgi:hypothetical protein
MIEIASHFVKKVMCRIRRIIITCIIIVFLLIPIPIRAAEPTPIPLPNFISVNSGTNNQVMELDKTKDFWDMVKDKLGNLFKQYFDINNFNYNQGPNDIIDKKNFKVLKLQIAEDMFTNAMNPLTPHDIQKKITPIDKNTIYISGRLRRCLTNPDNPSETRTTQTSDKYLTESNPQLEKIDMYTKFLGSYFTLFTFGLTKPPDKTEPTYDAREKALIIESAPDCGASEELAETQEPKKVEIIQGFGLLDIVAWLFHRNGREDITVPGVAPSKQFTPYSGPRTCRIAGCADDADLSYLPKIDPVNGPKELENNQNAGGITRTFFPAKATLDETEQKNHTEHPNGFTIQIEGGSKTDPALETKSSHGQRDKFATENTLCMILPKAVQPDFCHPILQEECKLPELKSASPACGVCNASSRLGSIAKKILEAAGQEFNVPAAAIYATMLHEGADWPEYLSGLKDDAAVTSWSVPIWCPNYKAMPKCSEGNPNTQPPFGLIKYWFFQDSGNDSLWTAVQKADPERNSKDKVSRCNFMDAAFGTAKELWQGAGFVPPAAAQYEYCGDPSWGFSLNNHSRPSSCSQWNKQIFGQASVAVAGQCPEPGQSGTYNGQQLETSCINSSSTPWPNSKCPAGTIGYMQYSWEGFSAYKCF